LFNAGLPNLDRLGIGQGKLNFHFLGMECPSLMWSQFGPESFARKTIWKTPLNGLWLAIKIAKPEPAEAKPPSGNSKGKPIWVRFQKAST